MVKNDDFGSTRTLSALSPSCSGVLSEETIVFVGGLCVSSQMLGFAHHIYQPA